MSINHVSLRQLRVFEAAATLRSFSKAAESLHLTQPGVSMHIKQLETNAGLALFERVGKKLHVTQAGAEMLTRAREILRTLKDAEDVLDGLKGPAPRPHRSGRGEHREVFRASALVALRQGVSAARGEARREQPRLGDRAARRQ